MLKDKFTRNRVRTMVYYFLSCSFGMHDMALYGMFLAWRAGKSALSLAFWL